MRGWRYSSIATLRLLVMTSRSSCEVSALATSSVVVPILMNSEQPFGIRAAADPERLLAVHQYRHHHGRGRECAAVRDPRRSGDADRPLFLGGDEAARI